MIAIMTPMPGDCLAAVDERPSERDTTHPCTFGMRRLIFLLKAVGLKASVSSAEDKREKMPDRF